MNDNDKNKYISPGISTREGDERYIDVKLHAIEFGNYISNRTELDDFWAMSREVQEEVYENFLKQ